jgi:hypothetical protein
MSKTHQVYIRGDGGKFAVWKGQHDVTFRNGKPYTIETKYPDGRPHYRRTFDSGECALFRDLDLSQPVPDAVRCVVCVMATSITANGKPVVNGDYVFKSRDSGPKWPKIVKLDDYGFSMWNANDHNKFSGFLPDEDDYIIESFGQHRLTHRIDNGKVVAK